MARKSLTIPVFQAKRGILYQAKEFLTEKGIDSRHSTPKRDEGFLRVAPEKAAKARQCLKTWTQGNGRVIDRTESRHHFCPVCGCGLSLGAPTCAGCGLFVGDPHGL